MTIDVPDVRVNRPGPSWQDLLAADSRPVPPELNEESPMLDAAQGIPVDRYLTREYHELEKERLWPRVWQFACREEHLPEPGDTVVYEIADRSVLIVRLADGSLRAYHNVCLHQGRQLRDYGGRAKELRCAYHGFCWNLDGTLKQVPNAWDFPHVEPDGFRLPQVQVDSWGGFVFVNLDPAAESLSQFLGALPRLQERWALEDMFTAAHVAKVLRCNWKVAAEAFMESMHVVATHPQALANMADASGQYDVYGNVSRAVSVHGIPSTHLTWTPSEEEVFEELMTNFANGETAAALPPGVGPRQHFADLVRTRMRPLIGDKVDEYCDAEINDHFFFNVFPNFQPWGGFSTINYRFRPWADDPEQCLMEVLILAPFAGERPPPAQVHRLDVDDEFTDAPELGVLARIFDQDAFNMPKVQKGLHQLHALRRPVTHSVYQQSKIRHFHQLYDRYLGR